MYSWPWSPIDSPLLALVLLALLAGHTWLAARVGGVRLRQRLFFLSGVVLIWASMQTPLETLARSYLDTAEMIQHMVLMVCAPPLMLLGLTPAMAAWLVERFPFIRYVTQPGIGLAIYAVFMAGWHLPPLYDAALGNDFLYAVEHLSFVVAGLIYWWGLIRATSGFCRRPLSDPQKLIMLFFGTLPMMAVALPLQFAGYAFYGPYAHAARVVVAFTAVIDQTVAGALMMTVDMSVMGIDALVVFFRWFNGEVSKDRRRSADPLLDESADDREALEAYLRSH
ncbi:MAG: cytochrome c oxidase assembly protein [Candidatus Dormibacteraeota bacterium]|nr:cytochrome c oxidase assembly protein [Candidatus Dormibacteraeota bacterium]MBO0746149.1 cytochrome c oxidase assembly protein [Candidatus Dormibacteraeota bacterium]